MTLAKRIFVPLLIVAFTAGGASARDRAGVRLPEQIQVGDRTLVLNGVGLRTATFFKVHVYVAGLYLERPTTSPEEILSSRQAKRLDLVFVRNVGRKDVTKAFHEGFVKNNPDARAVEGRMATFLAMVPSMHRGDVLSMTWWPAQGVVLDVNGRRLGVIPGDDFGRALFAIWMGPHPPSGALQHDLLQGPR